MAKVGLLALVLTFLALFQNCGVFREGSDFDSTLRLSSDETSGRLTPSEVLMRGDWGLSELPVLTKGSAGRWDSHSAYNPKLVSRLDGTTYRDANGFYYLYYTASDGSDGTDYDATGLAVSPNLVNWQKVSVDGPVLPRGGVGSVDAGDASAVTILHDGTQFLMWHEANATPPGDNSGDFVRIAFAESTDGRNWQKRGWVIEPGASNYDRQDVYAPVVIKDGARWRMWYSGKDEAGRIGLMQASAEFPQGPWTRDSSAFVFHPSDDTFASQAWKEGDRLYMLYNSAGSVWLAEFVNGVWVARKNLSASRLSAWQAGDPGSWPSFGVHGDELFLFFGANVYATGGIGFRRTSLLDR